jgi:diaminopimelate epimerase
MHRRAYIVGMGTPFRKMHGLGNDFVVFDGRETPIALSALTVKRLANRFTGIGCDQLIVLEPSTAADLFMRIYNADGGEVEACGNATRCIATLLGAEASIETVAGILHTQSSGGRATVDMGEPKFGWDQIPLAYAMDTLHMPVAWEDLASPAAVNVGNPHVVFFVADLAAIDLARLGPLIETDPLFPQRVNVNVAQVVSRAHINLSVWERGAGLTLACGTGACATAIAGMRRGVVERSVTVALPGGPIDISWTPADHILMTGAAATAFTGEVDLSAYA